MHHREGGGGGSFRWRNILHKGARKIILAQNLLRQDNAQSQVPVRFPVPLGTGDRSSLDHAEVQPCDR